MIRPTGSSRMNRAAARLQCISTRRHIVYCPLLITVVLLLGCAVKSPAPIIHPRTASFIESEYAAYENPGTATITGQAFLKTRGGDVKFAAGDEVLLAPATSYSSEWWQQTVLQGKRLSEGSARAAEFMRSTIADGDGRFRFDSLAAGVYYVATTVIWEVPTSGSTWERTGGTVGQQVSVGPGQAVQVILPFLRTVKSERVEKPDSLKGSKKTRRRGQP